MTKWTVRYVQLDVDGTMMCCSAHQTANELAEEAAHKHSRIETYTALIVRTYMIHESICLLKLL